MIGRVQGRLLENNPQYVLVEAGGIGYEIEVPLNALAELPAVGEHCALYTHLVVREDAHLLFGFVTQRDRDLYRVLLKVNGVGPKLALAILSHLSVDDLVRCVQADEVARLTKIPGVGKKTAERLLLDLRDRLKAWSPQNKVEAGEAGLREASTAATDVVAEAEAALVSLGYRPAEASKAINRMYEEGMAVDALIKAVLRGMVKG